MLVYVALDRVHPPPVLRVPRRPRRRLRPPHALKVHLPPGGAVSERPGQRHRAVSVLAPAGVEEAFGVGAGPLVAVQETDVLPARLPPSVHFFIGPVVVAGGGPVYQLVPLVDGGAVAEGQVGDGVAVRFELWTSALKHGAHFEKVFFQRALENGKIRIHLCLNITLTF